MTAQQENLSEKIVLSENDKKFMQDWENTKSKGFWRYVIIEGLGFGIFMFFFHLWALELYKSWKDIFINLAILPFAGFSYASTMWAYLTWKYKNLLKKINEK